MSENRQGGCRGSRKLRRKRYGAGARPQACSTRSQGQLHARKGLLSKTFRGTGTISGACHLVPALKEVSDGVTTGPRFRGWPQRLDPQVAMLGSSHRPPARPKCFWSHTALQSLGRQRLHTRCDTGPCVQESSVMGFNSGTDISPSTTPAAQRLAKLSCRRFRTGKSAPCCLPDVITCSGKRAKLTVPLVLLPNLTAKLLASTYENKNSVTARQTHPRQLLTPSGWGRKPCLGRHAVPVTSNCTHYQRTASPLQARPAYQLLAPAMLRRQRVLDRDPGKGLLPGAPAAWAAPGFELGP